MRTTWFVAVTPPENRQRSRRIKRRTRRRFGVDSKNKTKTQRKTQIKFADFLFFFPAPDLFRTHRNLLQYFYHRPGHASREIVHLAAAFLADPRQPVNFGAVEHQMLVRRPEQRPDGRRRRAVPVVSRQLVHGPVPVGDRVFHRRPRVRVVPQLRRRGEKFKNVCIFFFVFSTTTIGV